MISRSRVLIVAGLGTLVVLCPSFTLADSSTCTPALFERTSETIRMLNGAFEKEFHELQKAVADHPELTDGASVTWTRTMMSGAVEQTTLTQISTGNYSFEEDEASEDSPTIFVKVVSATLAFTPGSVSTPSEIKGSLSIDFDALASVVRKEPRRGQQSINFDMTTDPTKPAPGKKDVTQVSFINLRISSEDPHGPRTGNFTEVNEPQIGESLQFSASLVLPCPANPSGLTSSIQTAERKYTYSDGTIHSRGDANATGGQLPSGFSWMEAHCSAGGTTFRLAKEEDASSNTVDGSTSGSVSACDAVFGSVPQLANNSSDYNFLSVVTFPNEF